MSNSNIIWVTGLSCIGKSTLLKDLCATYDLRYIESDIYRNKLIKTNPEIFLKIQEIIGYPVQCWPLCAKDIPHLYKTIAIFLGVQHYIAQVFLPFLINIIEEEPKKMTLIEISPYILCYAKRNERTIFLTLRKETHIERLIKKTECNFTDANALFHFFLTALSRIDNLIVVDEILDIEEILPPYKM